MGWYVLNKSTGRAATFYLNGPDVGQPVEFETQADAERNAETLVSSGFYPEGAVEVSQFVPENSSIEKWMESRNRG